ncbi:hypothetical protein [Limosilactobacillus antri]|uniref:hypothetical protein n=1 Tax=Limosilactobacillus antri TaxID=227943 RepID=UPI001F58F85F|nr:hypothetical protein [Limosilactobacillus antri]
MNHQKLGITIVTGLALLLAGCGNQTTSKDTSSASSSSLLAPKTDNKISQDNLTPQQTVAVITAYAGNKYGNDWATTAKAGQQNGLQVSLYRTNKYQLSDNGQGVAYNVTANGKDTGLVYTVNGNNVTIYEGAQSGQAKKLTTVSRAEMVQYLNQNGQGQLVNNLATGAKVVDKTNGSLTAPASRGAQTGKTSTSTGQYGNEGPVDVPSELQGTWYTADNGEPGSVTFGAHTFKYTGGDNDGDQVTIYKQSPAFLQDENNATSQAIGRATKNWMRGTFGNAHGMRWLNLRGWQQTAGDGAYYAVHTETINGQQVKVLVETGGADMHVTAVYYQSQSMAKQQAGTKYDDLNYM